MISLVFSRDWLKNGRLFFGEEMCLIHAVGFNDVEAFGINVTTADFCVFHSQYPGDVEYGAVFHIQFRGFEFALDRGGASECDVGLGRDIPNDCAFGFHRPGPDLGFNHALMANNQ